MKGAGGDMKQQNNKSVSLAVYPGSFDPITNGHLDIVKRACELFGSVIIAISYNQGKKSTFTLNQRKVLIEKSLRELSLDKKARVETFHGSLTDFVRNKGAKVVIRGLRFISDFEYEFQMALMNRRLYSDMETVYLMPDEKHIYLSSSIVKEIAQLGKDPSEFVPACVAQALRKIVA